MLLQPFVTQAGFLASLTLNTSAAMANSRGK